MKTSENSMFYTDNSYSVIHYRKNRKVFFMVKMSLTALYFLFLYLFCISLQKTNYSLSGLIASSIIYYLSLKFLLLFDRQNKKDKLFNENTWGMGMQTELSQAASLATLPREYKFIHDFNTGKGNIDFIIIGPSGVFTIEVKSTKGIISFNNNQLLINGKAPKKDYLKQTFAQKAWLAQNLCKQFHEHFTATGILEFPRGKIDVQTIHGKINNVWVGGRGFYRYVVHSPSQYLSRKKIASVYAFLESQNKEHLL